MRTRWMAVLAAAALVGVGFLAVPALADQGGEASTSDDRGKGSRTSALADERKAQRDDARDRYHDEKKEARGVFHDNLKELRDAFHACKAAARANNTTDNATDCQALARDHFAGMRQDARHDYRLDKMRARLAYHDALNDVRPHGDDFRERCAAEPVCVERVIEKLEQKLERVENATADLTAKLDNATARYENLSSNPNATARELFKAKDLLYRLQIAILKLERHALHIESQLEYWYGVQDGTFVVETTDAETDNVDESDGTGDSDYTDDDTDASDGSDDDE